MHGDDHVTRAEIWICVIGVWAVLLTLLLMSAIDTYTASDEQRVLPLSDRA